MLEKIRYIALLLLTAALFSLHHNFTPVVADKSALNVSEVKETNITDTSLFLKLMFSDVSFESIARKEVLPAPVQPFDNGSSVDEGYGCRYTMDGVQHSQYVITNPSGISGISDYHIANYDQTISNKTDNSITIDLTARINFTSTTSYPIAPSAIPSEIIGYLNPQIDIQSTDQEIVALANKLVAGSKTEFEAMDRIFTWVHGNIVYDYTFTLKNDALSVLHNHSGTCGGFSNLAVALLRAAGIPSKVEIGCVTKDGWSTTEQGGWHGWINVYYLDTGWIATDPQVTENYVNPAHIFAGFSQCGNSGTVITRTIPAEGEYEVLYRYRIEAPNSYGMNAAHAIGYDGIPPQSDPMELVTHAISLIASKDNPIRIINLQVHNHSCGLYLLWQVSADAAWLTPTSTNGTVEPASGILYTTGTIPFTVNTAGLENGEYIANITYTESGNTQTVPVRLMVVDQVHSIFLPQVTTQLP